MQLNLNLSPSMAPVAEISPTLVWTALPLVLGAVAIVCALLLLPKPREQDLPEWELTGSSARRRGQYLQHLTRVLRAIRAINSLIVTERDSERLLHKACQTLTETRGYKMAWIGLVEEGTKRVYPVAQAGFEDGYLEAIQITWNDSATAQGPTGRAIKSGEPAVMRDIETEPEYEPWRAEALERGYRSSAALPLRFQGRVLGALNVYAEARDAFDIQEVGLLQDVADHIGYALASIRLEEELVETKRHVHHNQHVDVLFQNAPLGLLSTDVDGVITSTNQRMIRLMGGSAEPEQLVGKLQLQELDVFRSPATRDHVRSVFKECQPVKFRFEHSIDRDRVLSLCCRGTPVLDDDGNLTGTIWVLEEPPEEEAEGTPAET